MSKINPALNRPNIALAKVNVEHFLAKELLSGDDFFFVQIGANDGKRADDSYGFITKHHLHGIVVEPLRDMFDKLCENYASEPQIEKINKAIHADATTMPLYRIKKDAGVPDWCHGIGSFSREHLLSGAKKVPNIDQYIVEEAVDCISLPELFTSSHVQHISFLQIDTEGYDFEIIKMVDFKTIKPRIIRYECSVMSKADNQACVELLSSHGYQFFDEGNDIIAVL
ncbi:MAG: FkbM family methyltransferase [Desulfobulbaceae bacterium]|nr:FkbM family methyltransferase [Desulfobulbaceae bacterium]